MAGSDQLDFSKFTSLAGERRHMPACGDHANRKPPREEKLTETEWAPVFGRKSEEVMSIGFCEVGHEYRTGKHGENGCRYVT